MKKILYLLPLFLILAACHAQSASTPDAAVLVAATSTAATQNDREITASPLPPEPVATNTSIPEVVEHVLSTDILRNAVYTSPDWGQYQLSDGIYYRTPPTSQESPEAYTSRLLDTVFYGDINSDGVEDAVVFLVTQSGGSGNFVEMAAVLNVDGSAGNVSTLSLGDRVVIESGKIQDGVINLHMRVHGLNDGLCCPSQNAVWTYRLQDGQLVQMP